STAPLDHLAVVPFTHFLNALLNREITRSPIAQSRMIGFQLQSKQMLTKRIIACLDVDAGRVVKGIKFVGLRDAGDPAELAHVHADAGADEVVLLDISATHEGRATLIETVRRAARELFIPFTVG